MEKLSLLQLRVFLQNNNATKEFTKGLNTLDGSFNKINRRKGHKLSIAEYVEWFNKRNLKSRNAISSAFRWSQSKQDFYFWLNLSHSWHKFLNHH